MTDPQRFQFTPPVSRRSLLRGLGASTFLLPFAGAAVAAGEEEPDRRYVGFYMSGGWDILLGPDPRDPGQSYSGIDLGTQRLDARYRDPIVVSMGGEEVLWGGPMAPLVPHADILTIFNGINMNTVAHAQGRAYTNTLIPPSGMATRGDSMGTRMAAAGPYDDLILPNVSVALPSINLTFPADLTGVGLSRATDIKDLLQPLSDSPFSGETLAALEAAQDEVEGCVHDQYAGRPVDELRIARERMRELLSNGYANAFDLAVDADLMSRYGIVDASATGTAQGAPGVVAATTWRLLETGLSRSVTAQLQTGLDTHSASWETLQPDRLEDAFFALSALLSDLREDDPQFERTTVVVFSEFSRTPRINGSGGRDHHLANSFLVFGGGLRRGVCGATVPDTLGLEAINPQTGKPDATGEVLLPENVGATLAVAAGLSADPFRTDPLDAWIA